jgi:ribosomal protein S18 acetylase RimI-like enzyme
MNLRYFEDKESIYNDKVIYHLRKYNQSHTGEMKFEQSYIYAIEDGVLVGALTIYYFWDWVSINHVFYKNHLVLNALINQAWDKYGNEAVGIKLMTPVIDRWRDFLVAGFKPSGAVNLTENYNYYYADLVSKPNTSNHDYEMFIQPSEDLKYQEILEKEYIDFNKKNNITGKLDEIRIIALDNERFAGGITCEVYEDSLYISHMVVNEEYRKNRIGTRLISLAETKAIERNLEVCQLGTCEFQAKGFYDKMGYRVVHSRNDNPRKFKSYTMIKHL